MDHLGVKKRCVLFVNGYEPLTIERAASRLKREFQRSARTWHADVAVFDAQPSADGRVASMPVRTTGPDWAVKTDFRVLYWGDLVLGDFARPQWARLAGGALALADFVTSGAVWRYFRTNWRYGAFFCYPIVLAAVFAWLASWAGATLGRALAIPALWPWVAVAIFAGLTFWPGRPLFFNYLLDDWMFARDYARRRRRDVEERLDRFALELVDAMRASDADEIVLSGHSLGAAMALDVVARALRLDPALTAKRPLVLLSTGSSLLKVALHPAAKPTREAIACVARAPGVVWIEYQSVVDIISFYKVDPVAAVGLDPCGRPEIKTLRIRAMLDDATYRKFRFDFFRIHRQLVMGNERRHFYDFFMICCGPLTLRARMRDPDFAVNAFAPDGSIHGSAGSRAGGSA